MPNSSQPLKIQQVKDWLESPVTLKLIDLVKEHRKANFKSLGEIAYLKDLNPEVIKELYQLRGQVYTLDYLLDLEAFLEVDEEIEDEVQTDQIARDS